MVAGVPGLHPPQARGFPQVLPWRWEPRLPRVGHVTS